MAQSGPTLSEALGRAMAAHRAGDLGEAARLFTAIIDRNGQQPDALHSLGIIEYQRGRPGVAVSLIDAALSAKPDFTEALVSRGTILCAVNRPREALACYDQALLLNPDNPETLYNRGYALQLLGNPEAALASYDQALAIKPNFAEALNNRGNVLLALKRPQEALQSYDLVLAIKPDLPDALNNRGSVLAALDRPQEALESYDRALALKPDYADALFSRGKILHEMGDPAAIDNYSRALAIKPDLAAARFARCMAELPVLYTDETEIAVRRAAYEASLEALCEAVDRGEVPGDLAAAVGMHQPFYLPYQNYNDRELQARYGSLVCRIMAARYPPARMPAPPAPNERVRVGIVTGHFRFHAASKVQLRGWLAQLDRRQFQLFAYHTGTDEDPLTEFARATCDRFVQDSMPVERWRQTILADAPHVLIYPEIGIDSTSAALAAQRLAPIQCNAWGHPETSGYPTLDYFLGGDLMEPPDGQEHYTERLVRLPNLGGFYPPLDVPPVPLSRVELGLAPAATIYWCGQSLFKYLPQFDSVFARIARDAGDCQFVFFQFPKYPQVTELFVRRLERAFAALGMRAADYCVVLPRMDYGKFFAVFGLCDVFLDSIGFSGGNTSLESLSHDLPIVTLPTSFMRGRQSLGILRMMGVTETVTQTIDDYVAVAVRLARDVPWRRAVKERMSGNRHKVYRDRTCIAALEEFLNRVARGEIHRPAG